MIQTNPNSIKQCQTKSQIEIKIREKRIYIWLVNVYFMFFAFFPWVGIPTIKKIQ